MSQRNYVAAWADYHDDKIIVLERDTDGQLYRKKFNPPYYFYIPAEEGTHTSIFGDSLIRAEFSSRDEYEEAKRQFPVKFESDIAPLKRVLMDYYYDVPAPPVNYAFLDIEVDYTKSIGFAGPQNPYAIVNAITIYQSWTGLFLTYVVPPMVPQEDGTSIRWDEIPGNTVELLDKQIQDLVAEGKLRAGFTPKIVLCDTEAELFQYMITDLQDSDIISGWNSEFFDIPYIAERLILMGGESLLARLEHSGVRPPRKEMVDRFGSPEPIYKFTGRSHLDYMKLFQKFTFEGRVSYALGNILQEEVGVGKLEYDGSLEDLYKKSFPLFVAYNFRDVDGLVQLDAKFKFIALANQMAHENTVGFDAVLGTVAYVETGITNHAHNVLKKIVHDKVISNNEKVEGAVVMSPWKGLHELLGSVDLNSLYPNTIRSLNISPEMIIGQFVEKEESWRDIRDKSSKKHTLILESGEQICMSGADWRESLVENLWAISAYGTVFDQSKGTGVVADILGYWYTERKRLQAEKKKWAKTVKDLPAGPERDEAVKMEEHFDLLQLTKKISMNSLYGALLNAAFRFGDERMGASVTASGRAITSHMISNIGEFLTGNPHTLDKRYDPEEREKKMNHPSHMTPEGYLIPSGYEEWIKLPSNPCLNRKGENAAALYRAVETYPDGHKAFSSVIIYGDTDSCYYICRGATDKTSAIKIADDAAENVNNSFPQFMRDAFNCQPAFDVLIKAGREIVGVRGLFQAKKKYMVKVIDMEGFAVDKLKTQGSEIKKADTPKVIQKFLKHTVDMILDGQPYDIIVEYVNDQRITILKKNSLSVFELGVAKQVNNLDKYMGEYLNPGTYTSTSGGKMTIPGHARAACNFNFLLDIFDRGAKAIRSGDKVLVFHLKKNDFGFDTIAFPAELTRFPEWFTHSFSVDKKKTETAMFDSKLKGIFDALGKDVPSPQSVLTNKILSF